MELTLEDFRAWMKANRERFRREGYTREEVTELAILVGFDRAIIYPELSHYEDALRGSNIDNRAKMHIDHETIAIEMLPGKHNLDEQWDALGNKLNQGRDFDE